ncbi:MAG: hypothetical protein ACR2HR_17290 [Euzebya sp.]
MSDPSEQPTEEEIEAYYAQLREAPVGDLLMQCVGMLAAGAEAKLGRVDARVLIDSMASLVTLGEAQLGEAAEQLQDAVGQLQMAQVQLERQGTATQTEGEPGSAAQPAATAAQPTEPPPSSAPTSQKPATDKLWIPGRDG